MASTVYCYQTGPHAPFPKLPAVNFLEVILKMATQVIVVGGFLGAGKTTLLLQAARQLTDQGYRVGLVTNDQGKTWWTPLW